MMGLVGLALVGVAVAMAWRRPGHSLEYPFVPLLASMLGLLGVALFASAAYPHGSADWIAKGGYRSPIDGSICCGEHDCFPVPEAEVRVAIGGYYLIKFAEVVPQLEVQRSRDGQYWRCRRTDGTRRCFFAPVPNS